MADERVEAAAKALQSFRMMQQYGRPAPPEAWDASPDYIREDWLKHATAAIGAADAVEGGRVVWVNNTGDHRSSQMIWQLVHFWVFDGEELVVRKRRGV